MASYLIKRITAGYTAGYVLMCYSNEKDVIYRNWLPIIKLIDFKTSKLAYYWSWRNYLSLNRKKYY